MYGAIFSHRKYKQIPSSQVMITCCYVLLQGSPEGFHKDFVMIAKKIFVSLRNGTSPKDWKTRGTPIASVSWYVQPCKQHCVKHVIQ